MSDADVEALAALLREAADRHHSYEARAPEHDWSDWYAAYMTARQRGIGPDEAADAARSFVEEARHTAPDS